MLPSTGSQGCKESEATEYARTSRWVFQFLVCSGVTHWRSRVKPKSAGPKIVIKDILWPTEWVLALERGRGFPFHLNFPLLVCNVLIVTLETNYLKRGSQHSIHNRNSIYET